MDLQSKEPHQRNFNGDDIGISTNSLAKGSQADQLSNGRQKS